MKDFYNTFRTGLPLFYIFYLYIKDENLRPDPGEFYECPFNMEEVKSNLHEMCVIQGQINVPIYLTPSDYITQYEPNFLMLQLYYIYCRFRNVRIDNFQQVQLQFKDYGRIGRQESVVSGFTDGEAGLGSIASQELNIIPEEDSQVDVNSSHRSKAPSEHPSVHNSTGITPKGLV